MEQDDNTCPLCIKELDLEERNFKPCPCGYQVLFFPSSQHSTAARRWHDVLNQGVTDLPLLLASHPSEPQWPLSCLSQRIYRRGCSLESSCRRRVRSGLGNSHAHLIELSSNRRIAQQKKKKEKERKDLETLGRKQYLDVRIVQRNVVYVTGVGRKYAKEEVYHLISSPT